MTAYPGPEMLMALSVADRDAIHTALVEAARRDALTPLDLLKDKRWLLAAKVKREQAVDEEELWLIVESLKARADRSERLGMQMNPVYDRVIAAKVEEIRIAREQTMFDSIMARYKEKANCGEQSA